MNAPVGTQQQTSWLVAVASLIPLAAAMASSSPAPADAADLAREVEELELAEEHLHQRYREAPAMHDVAPHRILVIGDSHTAGTFGRALDLLLRTLPDTDVKTVGSCGLSPDGFLESKGTRCGYLEIDGEQMAFKKRKGSTPAIDALLVEHDPDLTIVELGANQIHTAMRDPEGAAADIRALATRVLARSSRCLWVGPPYGAAAKKPPQRIDHVYNVLASALPSGCSILDSRPQAQPYLAWPDIAAKAGRRGDGKHFDTLGVHGQHAARRWARVVFDKARATLDEPRPMPVPSMTLAEAALFASH